MATTQITTMEKLSTEINHNDAVTSTTATPGGVPPTPPTATKSPREATISSSTYNDNNATTLSAPPSNPNARPACFKSTTAEILYIVATTMSVGMTSILNGGLTVVTADIGHDLSMNSAEITWIMASAPLAAGSFLLFFGRVADITSRRWMFIGSLLLFALFSLATGFAKTGLAFDVLVGVLGLLSAASVPPAIGSLGAIYPVPCKRKNYAFACFSAGNPLGFVFGSIACGICTRILNWRAYIWFMAIVYLFFGVVAFFVTPPDTDDKKPITWTTIRSFDILGTFLTVAGFGLFSASLTLAGDAPQGWHSPYVLATLIIGILLIILFVYWETRAPDPLLPMWVWKDRDFSLLLLILFLGFGAFAASSFWITLYIQRFLTSSSLMVAVYILPMAIMGTIVNIIAGLILHRVSNKLLMYIGTLAYFFAFLFLGLNRDDSIYWGFIFWGFILAVWGADLQFNVANMYVMTSLPAHQQSTGGSIFQTVTRLATTIVISISTPIFNAVQQSPPRSGYLANQSVAPYSGVFFFMAALCAVSLVFVPLLRVGTQGGSGAGKAATSKQDRVEGSSVEGRMERGENSTTVVSPSPQNPQKTTTSEINPISATHEQPTEKDRGIASV